GPELGELSHPAVVPIAFDHPCHVQRVGWCLLKLYRPDPLTLAPARAVSARDPAHVLAPLLADVPARAHQLVSRRAVIAQVDPALEGAVRYPVLAYGYGHRRFAFRGPLHPPAGR